MTIAGVSCLSWRQVECLDAVARQLLEHGWVVRMPRPVPDEVRRLVVAAASFSVMVTVAVDVDHHLLATSAGRSVKVPDVAQLYGALRAWLGRPGSQQSLRWPA